MYSDSQKRATIKYLSKLKEIRIRVKPEFYDEICSFAVRQGFPSVRQFLLSAINEKMGKQ